jgi:hypothetical protein
MINNNQHILRKNEKLKGNYGKVHFHFVTALVLILDKQITDILFNISDK